MGDNPTRQVILYMFIAFGIFLLSGGTQRKIN